MSRICSYKIDFEKHLVDMKSWFQARGCPSDLIQKEMDKVKFSSHWDKNKVKKKSKGVPLVITFRPLLKDVGNMIYKNLHLLYTDQEPQRVFLPGPMITFCSAKKLSSYLVRADVSITFIDKTDPFDLSWTEDYWRETLKTMVLYGLNIEDSV